VVTNCVACIDLTRWSNHVEDHVITRAPNSVCFEFHSCSCIFTGLHLRVGSFRISPLVGNKSVDVFGNQNQVDGTCINVCDLSTREYSTRSSWRASCARGFITFMTGIKFIITLASFITQFVPAELKMMVSYTVLKIIPVTVY